MWTRFFPAITELKKKIYDEKVIGEIHRLFADLSYNCDISNIPLSSGLEIKTWLLDRYWTLESIHLLIQEFCLMIV